MQNESKKRLSNNEANLLTRESIRTALLFLMEKKDFDSITVSELVRKAGVSRQSFYRNYTSKENIVVEIEENILKTFAKSLNDSKYADNPRLWLYDLFRLLKKNEKMVSVLHKAKLFDLLLPKAPFIVENKFGVAGNEMHYFVVGILGALKAVGGEWLTSGMKESCDVMADICMRYFADIITDDP